MSLGVDYLNPKNAGSRLSLLLLVYVLCSLTPSLSQDSPQTDHGAPKYDQKTETKTKGVVDEVKVSTLGTRKDFVELMVKSGEDMIPIYLCPKPFEDEMGMTFSKGDQVFVTGSKVKQEAADVILAREVLKGTETLLFRDDKGNGIWDWRTGK